MLGIEGAIALVLARLEAEMPAKVTEVADRYSDATEVGLRAPSLYSPSYLARLEVAQYPAIECAPNTDDRPTWQNQEQGIETFWFPYEIRVYVTERGNSFAQTAAKRTRLSLAVREILFSTQKLQDGTPQAWIDNRSIRSTYSPTSKARDDDSRSIAASYTDLTVIVEEMTEASPSALIGTVDSVFVNVHPAMRS